MDFQVGTEFGSGMVNQSSQTYVAWNWKASNAASVLNEQEQYLAKCRPILRLGLVLLVILGLVLMLL
jgi:hypothetical protein